MTDLVIRTLAEHEASALFNSLDSPGLVGRSVLDPPHNVYRTRAEGGDQRPEWSWVALRDGVVVARLAFWGSAKDTEPVLMEWLDFTDRDAAVRLLRAAGRRPRFESPLPVGWEDDPATRAAALAVRDVAAAVGYVPLVERLSYRWTPAAGVPERPGRLVFRPEPDDEVVLDALRRVHSSTLDSSAARAVERGGTELAAREELEFFRWCPSPREWWRLAYTRDGRLAGIQVPVRNPSGPAVGFVGVVPEQRGHGYGYDLLVECTHHLADRGAAFVSASTDAHNTGMAKAFARAGYPLVRRMHVMVHPDGE
ncbi:GNAT family N-acetyltransferase [Streptomyces sp. SM14]|uniref:GNAT family N-acetyltransferase n=1 Tax=Streptomyces sp. SM14 TaxID=1736045 RepID=UPI000CD59756|nr:GNAT family N-acetyltransferase [Streptomyces sp. SM14]